MSPADAPVPVFVYFDYVCPYSYLALHLLDDLQTERPLRIEWRPLETRPADEGGVDWAELTDKAASLGAPLYRPASTPSTGLAHQATQFARDLGDEAHRRLHRAIFRAHFVRGIDIGRRENLIQLANEEGIDRQAFEQALEDGRYSEELAEAEREATRYDISETPTMLFGRFKVIGAATPEVIREAAGRAAAEI